MKSSAPQKFRIDAPPPIPLPDDIIIDMNTGLVRIKGPMTKEDKVKWIICAISRLRLSSTSMR